MTTMEWCLTRMNLRNGPRTPDRLDAEDHTVEAPVEVPGGAPDGVPDGETLLVGDIGTDRPVGALDGMVTIVAGIETGTIMKIVDQNAVVVIQIGTDQDDEHTMYSM